MSKWLAGAQSATTAPQIHEIGRRHGGVLAVDADGSSDTAELRTVFQQGGRTWLRAGASIVEMSNPDSEFEETCESLHSISRFLVQAGWPESGYPAVAIKHGVNRLGRG